MRVRPLTAAHLSRPEQLLINFAPGVPTESSQLNHAPITGQPTPTCPSVAELLNVRPA